MSADEKGVHDLDTLGGKASAFPKHEKSMPPSILTLPISRPPFPNSPLMTMTITYMRLLDADAEGADWREVVLIVLHIDHRSGPRT